MEELIIEQLCFSNGGLQQGQEVSTMLHHSKDCCMVDDAIQPAAACSHRVGGFCKTCDHQRPKEAEEEEEEAAAAAAALCCSNKQMQSSECRMTVTPVSSCSVCTASRAGTHSPSKSQEPWAAQTLAGNAGSCLACA